MRILSLIKRLVTRSGGFTLAEAIVAIGVMTVGLGLVGSTVFQSLSIERSWRDDVVAIRELRHAGSWFAGDALYAETTSLVDGATSVDNITLTWTDSSFIPHAVAYSISADNRLIRDLDGVQSTVARRVVQAGFSLSGRLLTFNLELEAEQGTTKTRSLQTYLRALQ